LWLLDSGVDVGVREFEDLGAVVLRPLEGRRITVLQKIGCLPGSGAQLVEIFFGLCGARFRDLREGWSTVTGALSNADAVQVVVWCSVRFCILASLMMASAKRWYRQIEAFDEPRYNIAPTSTIDIVLPTADGPALVPMRWD
jgi:hypothetical protein